MTREHDPRITVIQDELFDARHSKFQRYRDLTIGHGGVWTFLAYEMIVTCCSALPGAIGLFLRSKLYPLLLGRTGRNVTFGVNVVLRHPQKLPSATMWSSTTGAVSMRRGQIAKVS